jgi:hypothetical protein
MFNSTISISLIIFGIINVIVSMISIVVTLILIKRVATSSPKTW